MRVYLDTSIFVSLIVGDSKTERSQQYVSSVRVAFISDFGAAEFASALARRVRMRERTLEQGQTCLQTLDGWIERDVELVHVLHADISRAASYLRRLDLNLRTPDANHIAIAERLSLPLATLDDRMADCAGKLGLALAEF